MLHVIFVNFALIYYYFVVLLDYFSLHFLCACESVLISRSSDVKSVDHFCNLILHLLSKARRFVNSLLMNLASQCMFPSKHHLFMFHR